MNVNTILFSIFKNGAIAASWYFLFMYLTVRFHDLVKMVWAYNHVPPLFPFALMLIALLIAGAFKLAARIARNDVEDTLQES